MEDIVAFAGDLFFQSRISSAAKAAGRHVRFLTSAAQVASVTGARLGLVDLDAGVDALAAIQALKAAGFAPIVAFGPHVDTERRKAARSAGANRVLAKSKFVTELPRLMREAAEATQSAS